MKKWIGLSLCLLLVTLCAVALAGVPFDEEHFPDNLFRLYMRDFDVNGDEYLSDEELAAIVELDCHYYELSSFKGIEYFTSLEVFSCYGDYVTELDLSQNKALTYVDVSGNTELEKLVLGDLPKVWFFDAAGCHKLKEVDLSGCGVIMSCFNSGHVRVYYAFAENRIHAQSGGDFLILEMETHVSLGGAYAEPVIDPAHFPDSEFRKYVQDTMDSDMDGVLDEIETASQDSLIIYPYDMGGGYVYKNIQSLEGIQYLKNLEDLQIESQKLSFLNILSNPKLYRLNVENNQIKEIDISNCPALIKIVQEGAQVFKYTVQFGKLPEDVDDKCSYLCCDRGVVIKSGGQILFDGAPDATTADDGTLKYSLDNDAGTATVVGLKNKSVKKITIPLTIEANFKRVYTVIAIGDNAFKDQKKLISVSVGKNVASIGKNAFSGCAKLTSVTGMGGVTAIRDAAFKGCKKLLKITIPEKVKTIGKEAFSGCAALKTITIKTKKLTSKNVGANAFKGINKKAKTTCPNGKLKAYKKFLPKRGIPINGMK